MQIIQKPLASQTIVITGASSGIGLATAVAASLRGANVVLAARNENALQEICEELRKTGGQAEYVVADVGDLSDVERISEVAIAKFGGFDTWVNNAGVDIWGRIEEISDEDNQRLFQTNFWGTVHGSKVAIRHLKAKGGSLINVGSVASDRGFPLQGIYCASKHAVKAFTETLRSELEDENAPVSVTLIKPASVGTPLSEQAKNYLGHEPKLPSPIYAPEEVANAILYAATNRSRDIYIGFAGKVISSLGRFFPRLTDRIATGTLFSAQQRSVRAIARKDNLHGAGPRGGIVRSDPENRIIRPSLYTRSVLHPAQVAAGLAALVAVGEIIMARRRAVNRNRIALLSQRTRRNWF